MKTTVITGYATGMLDCTANNKFILILAANFSNGACSRTTLGPVNALCYMKSTCSLNISSAYNDSVAYNASVCAATTTQTLTIIYDCMSELLCL